jgi:hypothetical protein
MSADLLPTWMRIAERDERGDWLHVPDAPCTIAEAARLGLEVITSRDFRTNHVVMLARVPARGLPLTNETATKEILRHDA